jgi:hypothetical protein
MDANGSYEENTSGPNYGEGDVLPLTKTVQGTAR